MNSVQLMKNSEAPSFPNFSNPISLKSFLDAFPAWLKHLNLGHTCRSWKNEGHGTEWCSSPRSINPKELGTAGWSGAHLLWILSRASWGVRFSLGILTLGFCKSRNFSVFVFKHWNRQNPSLLQRNSYETPVVGITPSKCWSCAVLPHIPSSFWLLIHHRARVCSPDLPRRRAAVFPSFCNSQEMTRPYPPASVRARGYTEYCASIWSSAKSLKCFTPHFRWFIAL